MNIKLAIVTGVALLLVLAAQRAGAQFHPVQITTQLTPPYAVYLADYATPGNDKLRLVVLQRDLTKPSYQVRLRLTVEFNGSVIMRTSRAFNPPPLTLDPGVPMIISGADLQPYLDSRNLDFTGYSREEYERTKALPEGSYQICFAAYDYRRQDVPVSDPANCSFYWLAKSEPPLVNFPACGTSIAWKDPQQIIFSWLPRNTASPNSAAETEYEFALYEVRPQGRNPNDVVLSPQPVYRTVTDLTQLVYGPAEPILIQNLTYVWRVRALDKNGRDQFRNNGYSEACPFTYGGADAVAWQPINELRAEGESESRGKAWWTQQPVDGYKVNYKKTGAAHQWFSVDVDKPEVLLFDLEADTRYEVRVQPRVGAVYGPYSDIREFKTSQPREYACGQPAGEIPPLDKPLLFATTGMTIDVQGIAMTIKEVNGPHGEGIYNGQGEVSIAYFGGASFNVIFTNLYINEKRVAQGGRVEFITKGVDAMIQEQLDEQRRREREALQEQNREEWAGTDFYNKIFYYEELVIDNMYVDDEGNVVIVDEAGVSYINKDIKAILADAPDKAVIIEDKNGDQWVVQKDGRVTRVPAGGLSPDNVVVSEDALNIVKEALASLHLQYTETHIREIEQELVEKIAARDNHIKEHNSNIMSHVSVEAPEGSEEDANEESDGDADSAAFDLEENTPEKKIEDKVFEDLSIAALKKEIEYNRGIILKFSGNEENIDVASQIIAAELVIAGKPVSEYIDEERKGKIPDAEILSKVKEGIIALIDQLLRRDRMTRL